MLNDRRRDRRYDIHRMVRLQADLHALPRDCMITDISRHGARLFADHVEVPDRFHLLMAGKNGGRRECQVVWRLGGEIGIAFVAAERRQRRSANE
jgi:hypothetical protein